MKRIIKKLKKLFSGLINVACIVFLGLFAYQYYQTRNGICLLISCLLIFPYLSTLSYLLKNRKKKRRKSSTRKIKRRKTAKSKKVKKAVQTQKNTQRTQSEHADSSKEPEDESDQEPVRISTQHFDKMEGFEFEHFCASILKKNGFVNVQVTQESGDQGIDIIAYKDGIKYGIQCKCYSQNIGNKSVQEAYAGKSFYNCHVGAVFTNRYFTKSAKELAARNQILLWDRDQLQKFIRNAH